jgi:diguanylate cyclase (GGDEF)-like protein
VALTVLVALLAVHLLAAVGVLGLPAVAREVLYQVILAGAALLCVARAVLVAAERLPWAAFAIGMVLWSVGDLCFTALYGINGTPPFPAFTDALYLAFYVCCYVGLGLLLSARLRPIRRSLWLDGLVAGFTLAAFTAAFVFGPVLRSTEGKPLTVAVTLAYPVADLLLLCFVGIALAVTGWRPDRTWALIAGSFVLTAVADGLYAMSASSQTYVGGQITDTLWAASSVVLAFAAWPVRSPSADRRAPDAVAIVAPVLFALAALGLLLAGWFSELLPVAGLLATLGLLAAVARAGLTFGENVALLRASRSEALTDVLSGLRNRRMLMRDLETGLARPDDPQTLVFFDLDGFKHYNDAFGHVAGDALLARLAGKLAASVDGHGSAYRLGGDEFCVLFGPPVQAGDPRIAAADAALSEHGDAFSIGASYGITQLPREAATAEQAVRLADERMYIHKDSRRGSGSQQAHSVLVQVLVEREPELHEHLRAVALLAQRTAIELGLQQEELDQVVRGAELHDVGKIAVPDSVLHKPGPLDDGEWQIMCQHPVVGERILATVPALGVVGRLVRASHERWDGAGYPDHLRGEEIPLGARIIGVCDAFDAMTSARPYAPPLAPELAERELLRCSGTQFDPAVVAAFCEARAAVAPEVPLTAGP